MLGVRRISAVLGSGDLAQSQTFYEQVVRLTLSTETIPNHLLFECGDGTTLLVYGRPAPNMADHTQVRFWTDDLESDVGELESRGAVFQDYDFPTRSPFSRLPVPMLSANVRPLEMVPSEPTSKTRMCARGESLT